jgi:hypothetical protein
MSSYKITPFEYHGHKLPLAFCKIFRKQLIPNLVWKQIYGDYKTTCFESIFQEYTLKDQFQDILK